MFQACLKLHSFSHIIYVTVRSHKTNSKNVGRSVKQSFLIAIFDLSAGRDITYFIQSLLRDREPTIPAEQSYEVAKAIKVCCFGMRSSDSCSALVIVV